MQLFDIEADPGETIDLARREPERVAAMARLWREERLRLGILLPSDLQVAVLPDIRKGCFLTWDAIEHAGSD